MRLSALEIKKKEFQQKMRGYDPEEVQAFLEQASHEVDLLTHEKMELQERMKDVQKRLDHFLSLEHTLEKTLVAAQSTALKMEEQAKKEAELIIQSARLERDRVLNDIRNEMERVNSDLFHLKAEHESTIARMKAISEGFNKFLESVERAPRTVVTANFPSSAQSNPTQSFADSTPSVLIAEPSPITATPTLTVAPMPETNSSHTDNNQHGSLS